MNIYFYIGNKRIQKTYTRTNNSKLNELIFRKTVKKEEYLENPNIKLYRDIINLNKQINCIKIKSKKKGNSKLKNEL